MCKHSHACVYITTRYFQPGETNSNNRYEMGSFREHFNVFVSSYIPYIFTYQYKFCFELKVQIGMHFRPKIL